MRVSLAGDYLQASSTCPLLPRNLLTATLFSCGVSTSLFAETRFGFEKMAFTALSVRQVLAAWVEWEVQQSPFPRGKAEGRDPHLSESDDVR